MKSVQLKSGQSFKSLKLACQYFDKVRVSSKLDTALEEPLSSDIIDIYERYCSATNYPMIAADAAVVVMDNRIRPTGVYASSRAFAVRSADGEPVVFRMPDALRACAT